MEGARGSELAQSGIRPDGRTSRGVRELGGCAGVRTLWLSSETGQGYRLLSESEWEYVARAGTRTSRHWGDRSSDACGHASVADATLETAYPNREWLIHECTDGYVNTSPAGTFSGNGFGVHDVLGNVWEWVEDCRHESYAGAPRGWAGVDEWEGIAHGRVVAGRLVGRRTEGCAFRHPHQERHRRPAQRRRFPSCQDVELRLVSLFLCLLRGSRGRSLISANFDFQEFVT